MLAEQDMGAVIARLEKRIRAGLEPARGLDSVADVRVLGTIGVVEVRRPVDVGAFQRRCVDAGVWIRPFGRNVYIMPPYIITDEQLDHLCAALVELVRDL